MIIKCKRIISKTDRLLRVFKLNVLHWSCIFKMTIFLSSNNLMHCRFRSCQSITNWNFTWFLLYSLYFLRPPLVRRKIQIVSRKFSIHNNAFLFFSFLLFYYMVCCFFFLLRISPYFTHFFLRPDNSVGLPMANIWLMVVAHHNTHPHTDADSIEPSVRRSEES